MFLVCKSNNPQFSFLIGKNPHSPPKITSVRNGMSIGFYHNQDYCIKFIDSPDESSYSSVDFEYLDKSKFSSPMGYYNMGEYLKLDEAYDHHYQHEIEISCLYINAKTVSIFTSLYEEFSFVEIAPSNYRVFIKYEGKFSYLVNLFYTLLVIAALNENNIYCDISFIEANIKRIIDIDCPYFVRYLLKTQLLKNRKIWEKYSDIINDSEKYNMRIIRPNNQTARQKFVYQFVDQTVVDYGCGDGTYAGNISNLTKYIGYDRDLSILAKNRNRRMGEYVDNWNDIKEESFMVVCSEVIEHNTDEDLESLVNLLNNDSRITKIILTTPNRSFNKFYPNIEMRHNDHKFEFNEDEFIEFIKRFTNFTSDGVIGIGDSVDNIYTIQGVCLWRK